MDQHANAGGDAASQNEKLLDEASRAYMEGHYQVAIKAWQQVLGSDPGNDRARQGIKKVHMLQAEDEGDGAPSSEAHLAEVKGLMAARRFEDAAHLCRTLGRKASPVQRSQLNQLLRQAERARAVEPDIQRCLSRARRELKEGNVREALPHLKQVLALDREHPVAVRLMEAIRSRVRQRSTAAAGSAASISTRRPASVAVATDIPLPASGQPGTDAAPFSLDSFPEPPAPPGRGLPSSPLAEGEESVPEIELEMIPIDEGDDGHDVDPADGLQPGPLTSDVVDTGAPAIKLQSSPEVLDHRRAPQHGHSESPFEGAADGQPGESGSRVRQTGADDEDDPEDVLAGLDGDDGATRPGSRGGPELDVDALTLPPEIPARSRQPLFMAMAGLLILAGAGAWWMGWIPGTAGAPSVQPLQVPQPMQQPTVAVPPPATPAGAPAAGGSAQPADAEPLAGGLAVHELPSDASAEPVDTLALAAPSRDPRAALALFERGQDLFEAGQFSEAAAVFNDAVALDPVNTEIAAWQTKAVTSVAAHKDLENDRRAAVVAFERKDFEIALRKLYRLQEQNPQGPYGTYIANSWYNWGLQLLAAGNLREADVKLDEALALRAEDADAKGVKELIKDYRDRAKDRVFYLRVQSLRYRPLEG